ncbi:MAG: aspartate aminotransferase family protein [Pseudohongiella sp.]|uniref:aspartate aminotransferase family protein n=1 Tax=Pseudohongiella sp. TaxID=1979412 RepID=UPI00349FF706
MDVMQIEDSLGLTVCRRQPLVIERGEGAFVWDDRGNRLLDLTAGWGVTSLGHAHPVILSALANQAACIIQNPNSGFTYSPARARLLVELQQVLPDGLDRIYFANSGAEANDAALKFARKITGRQRVLAIHNSFHGRTLATLSVSGSSGNSARFLPNVPGNDFVSIDEFGAEIDGDTAAVIIEPVQGEGGVKAVPHDVLQTLKQQCRSHGALLIIDEVQTGFCRTGDFFAISESGVTPDIMTMGKGIAGGLPFAAFAMTQELADAVQLGDHGGTYCGNPLMCAVSAAVVGCLREQRVDNHVKALGQVMLQDLRELQRAFPDLICEVRGRGFMVALALHEDAWVWPLTDACQRQGVIVTPTRNAVVRLLPSLLLTAGEWQLGLSGIRAALVELRQQCAGQARCA